MTKEQLKDYITNIPDFPKKGIMFKDISGLLRNPQAYRLAINLIADKLDNVDLIVSPDARGFLFGPQVAIIKNIPFVMIRKPGKLPGKLDSISYELEYSKSTLEINKKQINAGDKVAIIDDVLATGETANAIIKLIKRQGGIPTNIFFLLEISALKGAENIDLDNSKIKSLIHF